MTRYNMLLHYPQTLVNTKYADVSLSLMSSLLVVIVVIFFQIIHAVSKLPAIAKSSSGVYDFSDIFRR